MACYEEEADVTIILQNPINIFSTYSYVENETFNFYYNKLFENQSNSFHRQFSKLEKIQCTSCTAGTLNALYFPINV